MAGDDRGPTLTDAIGMGGVIALGGFDYQIWEGLLRLPSWVANPAFDAMIFEGLEDIEARFFAPHAPQRRLLERIQAKSGALTSKDIKEIFGRFREFESAHPRVARVHTLVTQQLPPTLKWMPRDAARVRNARPFYAPFAGIRAACDAKLREDFVSELGDELGTFAADGIEITERPMPSRETAGHAFAAALTTSFPTIDPTPKRLSAAFDALEALARRSTGVLIERREIIELLESETHETLVVDQAFPLHVRSDRNGEDGTALEIDASGFSGGPGGFPPADRWLTELAAPLDATAAWLRGRGVDRLAIRGQYRLTTAFLLGRAFRAANGFELDIETRSGPWATDDRPNGAASEWNIVEPTRLDAGVLVVAIGVIRRPANDLRQTGIGTDTVLDGFRATPLTDARSAQCGVAKIKATVADVSSRLRPKRIDLYYAGPAVFAVAMGHRWNAMAPTHLFEFCPGTQAYVHTASCE